MEGSSVVRLQCWCSAEFHLGKTRQARQEFRHFREAAENRESPADPEENVLGMESFVLAGAEFSRVGVSVAA